MILKHVKSIIAPILLRFDISHKSFNRLIDLDIKCVIVINHKPPNEMLVMP